MSPSDLAELFEQNPSTRFRLTLASGDTLVVENPQRTLIDSLALYVNELEEPSAWVDRRTRVVSIPNIIVIEPLAPIA